MIKVKCSRVPEFLRNGEFYRQLEANDPYGVIEVPVDHFEDDGESASNLEELVHLVSIMIFWMLDEIPPGVLQFCRRNSAAVWRDTILKIPGAVAAGILGPLLTAYNIHSEIPFEDIIRTGRWEVIVDTIRWMDKDCNATAHAARVGDLRVLTYLHCEGFSWHEDTCIAASLHGHLSCLQFAHENGCPWDTRVSEFAAQGGNLFCLQYAHQEGLPWSSDVCYFAAKNGHLECLKYAHKNGCPWKTDVLYASSCFGHLDCLVYAFEAGLQWDEKVCHFAARSRSKRCLQYAHENGCVLNKTATIEAALNGSAACLEYVLVFGCPIHEEAVNAACQKGHLDCLRLLHEYGAVWDEKSCVFASKFNNTPCLQYLHENGCPWDASTVQSAAVVGFAEPVRYAIGQGCPYDDFIMQSAACGNSVDCLRYFVEDRLTELDGAIFLIALLRGDLACVQYLVDQGCPFNEGKFTSSPAQLEMYDEHVFRRNNPEFVSCLELAVERGYSVDKYFIQYLCSRDLDNCREYLEKEFWVVE